MKDTDSLAQQPVNLGTPSRLIYTPQYSLIYSTSFRILEVFKSSTTPTYHPNSLHNTTMAELEVIHSPSPGSEISSTLVVTPHLGIKMPVPVVQRHIGPHRTNLPRLGPRKRVVRKPSPPSSSSSSPLPSSSRSLSPSPSAASSSGHAAIPDEGRSVQAQPEAALIPVAAAMTSPAARPSASAASLTNLPRRRPVSTPHRRRRAWQIRSHMQELLPQSNLWSCFSASDEDLEEAAVMREFDRIVRIRVQSGDVEEAEIVGKTMTISVRTDTCYDDGNPNITQSQAVQVWRFLQDTDHSSSSSARPRTLIITSHGRAVDAVAIASGYLILSNGKENKILDLLCQIQDLDEDSMQDAWRGVLSSEGVERIEEALEMCRRS